MRERESERERERESERERDKKIVYKTHPVCVKFLPRGNP